jgi:hypothetical protein
VWELYGDAWQIGIILAGGDFLAAVLAAPHPPLPRGPGEGLEIFCDNTTTDTGLDVKNGEISASCSKRRRWTPILAVISDRSIMY